MSKSVLNQFKNQLGFGIFSASPSKPVEKKQPVVAQKEQTNLTESKRFNRSKDRNIEKESMTSIHIEASKVTTPSKVIEKETKKSILFSLQSLFIGKLIDPFNKIKFNSYSSSKRVEKGANALSHFLKVKALTFTKSAFYSWNFQRTNVSNKDLSKLALRNETGDNTIKFLVGRRKIKENLQFAFTKLKRVVAGGGGKGLNRTKPLLAIFNRQIQAINRVFFQKLNRNSNRKIQIKVKTLATILNKSLRQRLSTALIFIKFNNKIITQGQSNKLKRSNSLSKARTQKQSFTSRKPQEEMRLQSKILQQQKVQSQLQQKFQSFREKNFFDYEEGLKLEEAEKRDSLESQLTSLKEIAKKQEQERRAEEETDDVIRASPNDSLFYQKIKAMYLDLKQVQSETISKNAFIQGNHITFDSLHNHTDYLLQKNFTLRNEVARIQEIFLPVQNAKVAPKANREIQQIKEELSKENDVLKRSVAKYVTEAYHTQWLFAEAKKLKEELHPKFVDVHQ